MSDPFDAYHQWMGIPPAEQPPHHYRLLGIPLFEDNPTVIENAADQRMAHLRLFQAGAHSEESQRLLNEVAAARVCLLNPQRKAVYDAVLRERYQQVPKSAPPQPGEIDSDLADFLITAESERRSPAAPAASVAARPRGAPPGRWLFWAGGALGLLILAVVAFVSWGPRETVLVFDWAPADRQDVDLAVDGRVLMFLKEGPLEYPCEPGRHRIEAIRPGFQTIRREVNLSAGQRETIVAAWVPQVPPKPEAAADKRPSPAESASPAPPADGSSKAAPPAGHQTAPPSEARPPEMNDSKPKEAQAPEAMTAGAAAPEQKPEAKTDGVSPKPAEPTVANSSRQEAGDWIDLLKLADVDLHRLAGVWTRSTDGIAVEGDVLSKFMFPVAMEGSYEVEMKFTRRSNRKDVLVTLPAGHGVCQLALSAWEGGGHTFVCINRRDDVGTVRPGMIVNDAPHTVEASVRVAGDEAEIVTRLDGQPCCQWKGDSRELSCRGACWTWEWRCPGVASNGNKLTVHEFRVRPVGKQGRILPLEKANQEGPVLLPAQGRRAGLLFHESAPAGASLVGLRLWREVPICGVQPIWRGADGREIPGGAYGRQQGKQQTAKAKEGYAVGEVRMRANEEVASLQLVFMRIREDALDPDDSYVSPWIGDENDWPPLSLSGSGRPLLGIYGYSEEPIRAFGLLAARDPKDSKRRFVRLTELSPLSAEVGFATYEVNWSPGAAGRPVLPPSTQFCQEYLFAHAPSRVSYAIPKGARSFSAVGYCATPGKLKYQVFADDTEIFSSDNARIAPVLVDLPLRARVLHLVVDHLGDPAWDHSFWLLPRLHRMIASQVRQVDSDKKHVKLTLATPIAATVGPGQKLLVNAVPERVMPPLQVLEWRGCNEYCFAHAISRAVYAIPPGVKGFTAVGYNVFSGDTKFLVRADGKLLFESPKAGVVPITVRLPKDAKRLELLVDDCGDRNWDDAAWCYPRLWW